MSNLFLVLNIVVKYFINFIIFLMVPFQTDSQESMTLIERAACHEVSVNDLLMTCSIFNFDCVLCFPVFAFYHSNISFVSAGSVANKEKYQIAAPISFRIR